MDCNRPIPRAAPPHFTDYHTPADLKKYRLRKLSATASFYWKVSRTVLFFSRMARKGGFGDRQWYWASGIIREAFERNGASFTVEGTVNLSEVEGPVVIIGNHMSTAETFLLAEIALPHRPITFVVKQSLVEYPVFKHIMRSRNPVVVGREDPRKDLKAVLEGGEERLQSGTSVVVFPQKTRQVTFDPAAFNSIGVKLAKRAGVPVIPMALKTNAWSNGKRFKDFGPFLPDEAVRFRFGKPLSVEGNGPAANRSVVGFIQDCLMEWGVPVQGA